MVRSPSDKSFPEPVLRRMSLLEDHRLYHPSQEETIRDRLHRRTAGKTTGPKQPRLSRWKRLLLFAVVTLIATSLLGPRAASASSTSTSACLPDLVSPSGTTVLPPVLPSAAIPVAQQAAARASDFVFHVAFEVKLMLRLVYASFVGACLGKERAGSTRSYPASAGVRTMALVSLGAATFTVCSAHGFATGDPSRMAANVASGVGFVGAGVITTTTTASGGSDTLVHGLTTAAAIWLSAAVGVASGVGLYGVSATGAALTIAILRFGRTSPLPSQPRHTSDSAKKPVSKSKSTRLSQSATRTDVGIPSEPLPVREAAQTATKMSIEGSPHGVSNDHDTVVEKVKLSAASTSPSIISPQELLRQDVEGAKSDPSPPHELRIHRSIGSAGSTFGGIATDPFRFWSDPWYDDVIVHRHPTIPAENLFHRMPGRFGKFPETVLP